MDKFIVSATVDDPDVIGDAKFTYKIIDNDIATQNAIDGLLQENGYSLKELLGKR